VSTRQVDNAVDGAGYIVDGQIALHRRRGQGCGHIGDDVDDSPRLSTHAHRWAGVIPKLCWRSPRAASVSTPLCTGAGAHGKPLCCVRHPRVRWLSPPSTAPMMTTA